MKNAVADVANVCRILLFYYHRIELSLIDYD